MVTIKTYVAPPIDKDEIFRYAKIGAPTEEINQLVELAIAETKLHAVYKACYAEFPIKVSENKIIFPFAEVQSGTLATRLASCDKAILLVTTIGLSADRLIEKYKKISPSKAFVINSICTERIESLTNSVQRDIALEYESKGAYITNRYSPGYGDLPLDFQRYIFSVLAPEKNLGVSLNDSLLMSPSKSVTAIIGIKSAK